ncbi:hypothetical protein E3P89_02640 [Wallemia ichthyophaga]|uniref:Small ribosomal subunit protein uS10m n=2 Tax=Wallemia ichthyophaga TaxID=245174 RepID=A0A4T0EZH4_WALIC|nr:uncharacterized protein J056_001201 [Wallemia ichthyophaga EXF-994]TIA71010.1 hypothetical protein E3P91_02770 [Wallemia ichthyophaga]EOQ99971.1 hypothetical protein J056_001201 [Wallemia ichthyophaga EXF-994]TIA80169.1 hypothetical protein E3P98_02844 [Wallemia ichthyophaga]TIA89374.1 hypothetical protein E3P97_03046 [Wallemia ichthyophaga]TIA97644.1 hypothetical protein E3P95_02761 [Wallemia ichthyophaga]
MFRHINKNIHKSTPNLLTRGNANFPRILQPIQYDDQPSTNNLYNDIHNAPISFKSPVNLPKTHNIPIATLQLKAHSTDNLDFFADFAQRSAYHLGIVLTGPVPLPTTHQRYSVLKSPFVHKKSQEIFEKRTHGRLIKVWDSDEHVVKRWIAYLDSHSMSGVRMKFELNQYLKLNFGDALPSIANDSLRSDDIKHSAQSLQHSIIENLHSEHK